MQVKFLPYDRLYTAYQDDIDAVIKRSLVNGKLILQEDVEEFERKFAEFLGVKHVVALNSGTDALLLALVAAGVGPGDEVITVSHTFIATIQVIHHLGAKPVLVDVGEDGLMDIEKAAAAWTKKTKAIIPVHLSGDYMDLTYFFDLPIIHDSAQALGAEVPIGFANCYSFYPAKVLGTFGDAGALVTNDDGVAWRVRSLRNHGGVTKYDQEQYEYGWNSRMDNIWAATLNVKLDELGVDLKKRGAIAKRYLEEFKYLPFTLPVDRHGRIWQDFVIRLDDPKSLADFLSGQGIETLGVGQLANHKHPGLGLEHYSLPTTEKWVVTSLRLPCNHVMTPEEVDYVIEKVRAFYGK